MSDLGPIPGQVLPCFVCDKELEPASPSVINQPYGGTVFFSRGHYGSTVWDPIDVPLFLEITICDDCLKSRNHKVLMGKNHARPQPTFQLWSEAEPE